MELQIYGFWEVLKRKQDNFCPVNFSFDGEQPEVIWSQVRTVGRMGQNLDVLLLKEQNHKILRISFEERVTNEEVCAKIQQAIGPHEDLLTIVERRKLQWYGHVSRSSGLAKTICQDTVKGGRRQGKQKKRW